MASGLFRFSLLFSLLPVVYLELDNRLSKLLKRNKNVRIGTLSLVLYSPVLNFHQSGYFLTLKPVFWGLGKLEYKRNPF